MLWEEFFADLGKKELGEITKNFKKPFVMRGFNNEKTWPIFNEY